jgi:hypothetical protein
MNRYILLTTFLAGALLAVAPDGRAAGKITVSRKNCATIVTHTPSADVTYKPGVDVRERKVVPADLGGGSPIKLPKEITIDIGIDLEEKYGLGAGGDYTGTTNVGKVTVKNGHVTFNGQPLGNQEQQAITAACRNSYKK